MLSDTHFCVWTIDQRPDRKRLRVLDQETRAGVKVAAHPVIHRRGDLDDHPRTETLNPVILVITAMESECL